MTLADLVLPIVEELLATAPDLSAEQMPAAVHAALWPHVQDAVQSILTQRDVVSEPTPAGDRRARPWQYTARFWRSGELIAETEVPLIMRGTGELPAIVERLLIDVHAEDGRPTLTGADVKARLSQIRNNLARYPATSSRFVYAVAGDDAGYICQIDIYRLA